MECPILGVKPLSPTEATVLVVLPTLGERLTSLERALQSALRQDLGTRLRIAVVAPKAAKAAKRLASQYGADFVVDPGRGMSAAINAALATASTERYSIWLGDDDLYRPGGIARLLALMEANPDAIVAYGGCDYVDETGAALWTSQAGGLARRLLGYGPNLIPHPAALIRLDALRSVGLYDESLRFVMDLDVFLKLKRRGRFVHTRDVVSAFGWHPDSLTVHSRRGSEAEARVVKRRYLHPLLRPIEPLWEYPVAWASRVAAHGLNRRVDRGGSDYPRRGRVNGQSENFSKE